MKLILIFILSSLSAIGETVTLTDTKGRAITCELINSTESAVSIMKEDGKAFEIKLSLLDEHSRKIVADFETARLAGIEAARPKGIVVSSQAVKRIKASSIGGTFRYFFYVKNHEAVDWSGTVIIRLIAQNGIKGKEGEFKVAVPPGGGASGFFDASVGPVDFHGEYGVVRFEVEAKDETDNPVVVSGGTISPKFEDLAE